MKMKKIDCKRLAQAFSYDPSTGIITNKHRTVSRVATVVGGYGKKREKTYYDPSSGWQDMPAEVFRKSKYPEVRFEGRWLLAHRVAWALHYNEWPDFMIDHVNRDPADNRIANLRKCTQKQNAQNRTKAQSKTSKYLGVCKVGDKWQAAIGSDGNQVDLGRFDDERDAAIAYDVAAITMYREFANPNIVENPYLTRAQKRVIPKTDKCA